LIFPEFVFRSRFTKAEKADTGKPEKIRLIRFLFKNLKKINQGDKNDERNESVTGG
jgi:hypothetical protein